MILTGKAAEYAQRFEKIDAEMKEAHQVEIPDLTENDQINFFNITVLFEKDEVFKMFISGCMYLYIEKRKRGRRAFAEMLTKMKEI